MYGLELERGLDQALGSEVAEYDPRRSIRLRRYGSRRLQKKRVVSSALVILKDKDADRRGAVDSVCHFPESPTHDKLPPVTIQYTLQLRNADKLQRFVRLAQFRGGKHLYVMVDPGNEDDYPYHLFIAARFLREELYALAADPDPHAIWVFYINRKYAVTVYHEPYTIIARYKRRLEQRRKSKSRVQGEIMAVHRGHGVISLRENGEQIPFNFENVVDPGLRLVLQSATRHGYKSLVLGLLVSCEQQRNTSAANTTQAISVLPETDLSTIKRTLYETFVALADGEPTNHQPEAM